ncbi:MAG: hypothetical protein K0R29_381 [Pseudobdellovibrio sp.]|jgi:hypothetical protein|nr:hypothetical protein [Pseudobdellovibrio sp.]
MRLFKTFAICFLSLAANAATDFPDQEKILNVLRANPHFTITAARVWQDASAQPESFNTVVLVDNESKWKSTSVMDAQLLKSSRIFEPCGVVLKKALVLNVSFTASGLAILGNERPDPSVGPAEILIARSGLPANIMTGVLVKNRTRERDVAYAFNRSSVERASQSGKDWSSLLYSYWVSDKYISNPPQSDYVASYSTLAHELTHILGDLGHTDDYPNLMSNSDKAGSKSGALNREQCSEIKKNMIR